MEHTPSIFTTKSQVLLAFVALLACCVPTCSMARSRAAWWGEVTYVVDGDTVQIQPVRSGKPLSIRIDGIDAPEICQAGGKEARDALKRRTLNQRVSVHGTRRDIYGRLLARIVINGEDQGEWMVAEGLAWSYRYRGHPGRYALQQRSAEVAGIGLFTRSSAAPPVNPRIFRKQHGSCYV